MPAPADPGARGLRDRKKARTRATIQHTALALFREHGYAATTVQQIAAAAEVSESTFFRYFPAKEDLVLTDDLDPLVAAAFRAQPADLGVVAALRRALRSVFETMSADDLADIRDRSTMVLQVPELWGAALVDLTQSTQLICALVAERVGRQPEDVAVRTFAGALTGVMLALLPIWAADPDVDLLESLDDALAFLEAGLPLGRPDHPDHADHPDRRPPSPGRPPRGRSAAPPVNRP